MTACRYCDSGDHDPWTCVDWCCIRSLAGRIAKLEAQLGAAERDGLSTTRKDVGTLTSGFSASPPAAAPSVSAERSPAFWRAESSYHRNHNSSPNAAIACDLAAWVTEFMGSKDNLSMDEALKLCEGLWAFCRGEKLPEVGT